MPNIMLQTVSWSVVSVRNSRKHWAELRNMETSPGGTPAEAIYQMEKGGTDRPLEVGHSPDHPAAPDRG